MDHSQDFEGLTQDEDYTVRAPFHHTPKIAYITACSYHIHISLTTAAGLYHACRIIDIPAGCWGIHGFDVVEHRARGSGAISLRWAWDTRTDGTQTIPSRATVISHKCTCYIYIYIAVLKQVHLLQSALLCTSVELERLQHLISSTKQYCLKRCILQCRIMPPLRDVAFRGMELMLLCNPKGGTESCLTWKL